MAGDDSAEFQAPLTRFDRASVMAEVRRLSQVSNFRSALLIGTQWAIIVAAFAVAIASERWWVWLMSAFVIGTRQQALGILMHDGAHYLLFTNRRVNDVVSDLLLAFPIGLSTTLYRHAHGGHHRFTSTPDDPDWALQQHDPDWRWPKSRGEAARLLLSSLFGLNLMKGYSAFKLWSPAMNLFSPPSKAFPGPSRVLYVGSTLAVYGLLVHTWAWKELILLWAVPALTLFNFFNRVRATSEHALTENTHELNATRTVLPTWWERWMIAPCGINYHIEHHVFPSVPCWNLPALHRVLMSNDEFRQRAHLTRSYWHPRHGVLGELLTPGGKPRHGSSR